MDLNHPIVFGFLNALWIVGVWNAALPGQVLDPIATWMAGDERAVPPIKGNAPDWINKPLFMCAMCMASVHGLLFLVLFQPFPVGIWPIYIVCLSGLMKVISILILNKDY